MNNNSYSFDYFPDISKIIKKSEKSSLYNRMLERLEGKIRKQNEFLTTLIQEWYISEEQAKRYVMGNILTIRQKTEIGIEDILGAEYENITFAKNPEKLVTKIEHFIKTGNMIPLQDPNKNSENFWEK